MEHRGVDLFGKIIKHLPSILPTLISGVTCFVVLCLYIRNKRSGSTSLSGAVQDPQRNDVNQSSELPLNISSSSPQQHVLLPSYETCSEQVVLPVLYNVSEARLSTSSIDEINHYATVNEEPSEELDGKNITFIKIVRKGGIYNRWLGSIHRPGDVTSKHVVLTTLTEKIKRKKMIKWECFIKKCLDLPKTEHIAKVEGFFTHKKNLYLVSEHLLSETLDVILTREHDGSGASNDSLSVSIPDVIQFIAGILEGMDILNRLGFLHPGLSTNKILITEGGCIKLYDFCLAYDAPKIATLKKKMSGSITLNKFPPESIFSDKYTDYSDVWLTAIVICEILSEGQHPFPEEIGSSKDVTEPMINWPSKYKDLKNEVLFKCWNQDCSLRPSIIQLRETFVVIFEKLIDDGSYEIPKPTMYTPIEGCYGVSYKEHIYHASE